MKSNREKLFEIIYQFIDCDNCPGASRGDCRDAPQASCEVLMDKIESLFAVKKESTGVAYDPDLYAAVRIEGARALSEVEIAAHMQSLRNSPIQGCTHWNPADHMDMSRIHEPIDRDYINECLREPPMWKRIWNTLLRWVG